MSRWKEVNLFSSGPALYGKRKCEVIGSVVMTQSQKVMGWKREKNRVPHLHLLGVELSGCPAATALGLGPDLRMESFMQLLP